LYVLAKRNEVLKWSHKKHNGIYFLSLVNELIQIFKPEKEEEFEISIPTVLYLSSCNFLFFKSAKEIVMKNPSKLTEKDVILVLDLIVANEPKELSHVLKTFYPTHSKVLIQYQDKIITKEEHHLNFEYLFQLSYLNPSSILESLEKLKVNSEESLISLIQLLYRTVHISSQSCFYVLEKHQKEIDESVKIQNEPNEIIYIYGIIGRALDSEKNAQVMVQHLLTILKKTPRYHVYKTVKALSNILTSKPNLLTEDVLKAVEQYKDDVDYDIRRIALDFTKKSNTSEDLLELKVCEKFF
jgi:hypothetical protein